MEINAIIQDVVIAASTATITWIFSRKKQNAEIKKSELDNVEQAIVIWRGLAEDLGKKVDDLTIKCEALSTEIEALRTENRSLKSNMRMFNNKIQPK